MSRTLAVDVIKNHRFIISGNEPALLLFAFLLATLILANGCRTAQKPAAARAQAREGNAELIELFLRAAMSPNATNKLGYTALMWASGQGREAIVSALLAKRANPMAQAPDGSTALADAAFEGQIGIARLLLAHGA